MTLSWLVNTTQGRMVGDYISASFHAASPDTAFPVFMVATAPTGSTFHEAANTVSGGLTAPRGRNTSAGGRVLATASVPAPAANALTAF